MADFLQLLVSGLSLGAVYALVALGFVVIYRASQVFNFAQAEFLTVGAFMVVTFAEIGLPWIFALLAACQRIETECGRERERHWGPRTLDLDILYWEGVHSDRETLRIPHPGLSERVFTVVPLLDIAPDLVGRDGRPLSRSLTLRR